MTHALFIQISQKSSIIGIVVLSKIRMDLKWPEMRLKVNFGYPKWAPAAILYKNSKKKKFSIDLKWPEMRSKVNFGHPKWPTAVILSKKFQKNKILY